LLDQEPPLRWIEVPGAIEYVLHLGGAGAFDDLPLRADQLSCGEDEVAAPKRVCSAPWPAAAWRLKAGLSYFLTISARTGMASPLRPSEPSDLYLLADTEATEVQSSVKEIQRLALDPATNDLLLAGLYAEKELYDDAIAAYVRARRSQPSPVVLVTLGDIYRKTSLYRWAFQAYDQALALLSDAEGDNAWRAAAEFGIAQVYYNYEQNYVEAAKHYANAIQSYTLLGSGAADALHAAEAGLKECERRTKP
jgi:tetratricopeptide (TPR) repeat protein